MIFFAWTTPARVMKRAFAHVLSIDIVNGPRVSASL